MSKLEDLLLYNMVLQNDIWIPNKNPITECAYVEREKEDPVKQLEEARKALEKYKPKEEPKLLFEPIYDFGKDFERRLVLSNNSLKVISSGFYPITYPILSEEDKVKKYKPNVVCSNCGKKRYFSGRKAKRKICNLKCRKCKNIYIKSLKLKYERKV